MNILILQKNTGKAGAQNSLRRLLSSEEFKKHSVVVVTGLDGWFVEEVKKLGVAVISVDFRSSRSVYGRFVGNLVWLTSVLKELKKIGFVPDVMQANNHVEVPFLMLLKNEFSQAVSAVFLRDGYIKKSTYQKYQCNDCDVKIAVSQVMADAVYWDKSVVVINNGVFENEIYAMPDSKSSFPKRWLVIGNSSEGKGWFDFLSALSRMVESGYVNDLEKIVFTGIPLRERKLRYEEACRELSHKIDIEFVKSFENLGLACKDYDLIISPSRKESFGMALLEACCSRKCVISSRTGIADLILLDPNLLYSPGNVDELVSRLKYVLAEWPDIPGISDKGLEVVRKNFSVEENAKKLLKLYGNSITRY